MRHERGSRFGQHRTQIEQEEPRSRTRRKRGHRGWPLRWPVPRGATRQMSTNARSANGRSAPRGPACRGPAPRGSARRRPPTSQLRRPCGRSPTIGRPSQSGCAKRRPSGPGQTGAGLDHTVAERAVRHGGRSRDPRILADHDRPVGWNDGVHPTRAATWFRPFGQTGWFTA